MKIGVTLLLLAISILSSNAQTNEEKLTLKDGECNVRIMIASLPLTGHLNPFIGIAQELARRGCKVTVPLVHTKVAAHQTYANRTELNSNLQFLPMYGGADSISLDQRADISNKTLIGFFMSVREIIPTFMNFTRNYIPALRPIFDNPSTRPQLMVGSPAAFPLLMLAEQYNVPIVTSMPGLIFEKDTTYLHVPNGMSGMKKDMNWYQRIFNALFTPIMSKLFGYLMFSPILDYRYEFFTTSLPSDPQLQQQSQLKANKEIEGFQSLYEVTHLQQTCFGFEYTQPLPPRFELVGPIFPAFDDPVDLKLRNDINSDDLLSDFIQRNPRNIIYVALGTQAVISTPLALRLLEGLAGTGRAVLWSLPKDQREFLPSNYTKIVKDLFLVSYITQRSILQEPSVILFLSHTGASSAHESLFYGKPLVCMPFFGDQFDVCAHVLSSGAGLSIDKSSSTPSEITDTLSTVISTPSFKENAEKVGKIFKNCGGVDRAVELMQRELNVGSDHLKLVHKGFNWYFKYEWDIFFTYILFYLVLPYYFLHFLVWLLRKVTGRSKKVKRE